MAIELLVAAVAAFALRRWLRGSAAGREWLLLLASAALLAHWQPVALLIAVVLTLATWVLVREQVRGRIAVAASVVALVFALILFKVGPELGEALGGRQYWPVPLGISFLLLRLIGVALDAAALATPVGLRQLLLLALFFPTYRSGPITTLRSLEPLPLEAVDVGWAADRIVLGLARKRLLADFVLALVVRPWSSAGPARLNSEQCLLLPFALGLWLYWDFAGYSDIAIGISALLGYRVPENFDRPYLSRNIVEFWRRWHMSLSDWIRVRVFLKLTGRRPSPARVYAAAVLSMVLCGLWHGARGGFMVWGLWHGSAMAVALWLGRAERRYPSLARLLARRWSGWAGIGATYVYVSFGWLPFFLPVSDAGRVASKAMEAFLHLRGPMLLLGLGAVTWLVSRAAAAVRAWPAHLSEPLRGVAYAVVLVAAFVFSFGSQPFVYFRF